MWRRPRLWRRPQMWEVETATLICTEQSLSAVQLIRYNGVRARGSKILAVKQAGTQAVTQAATQAAMQRQ